LVKLLLWQPVHSPWPRAPRQPQLCVTTKASAGTPSGRTSSQSSNFRFTPTIGNGTRPSISNGASMKATDIGARGQVGRYPISWLSQTSVHELIWDGAAARNLCAVTRGSLWPSDRPNWDCGLAHPPWQRYVGGKDATRGTARAPPLVRSLSHHRRSCSAAVEHVRDPPEKPVAMIAVVVTDHLMPIFVSLRCSLQSSECEHANSGR
jgi:hypothetical protein